MTINEAAACLAIDRHCAQCGKPLNAIQAWLRDGPDDEQAARRRCRDCYAQGNARLLAGLEKIEANRTAMLAEILDAECQQGAGI